MLFRISNYYSEGGEVLAAAKDEFALTYRIYRPPRYWGWLETGALMSETEIARLHRLLNRFARRSLGQISVARLLIDATRRVARGDSTVGKDLMVVIIPKATTLSANASVSAGAFSFGSQSVRSQRDRSRDILSFFVPHERKHAWEAYAPNFSRPGLALHGVKSGPL